MKELMKKFEDLWISVAFAEAGEHDASREFLLQEVRVEENGHEVYTAA